MEAQDVDSSMAATLTCLMTNVSHPFNVTWFRENEIITFTKGGYSANQGKFKLDLTRFDKNN